MSSNEGLPVGHYNVRGVEGSELYGKASNGGIQAAVELEVVDGDFAGERVYTVLSFSGKAKEYSVERLLALGWNYEYTGEGKHVGIGSNTVKMEAKIDAWTKPDGSVEEKKKYEIKTGGGRFKFKEELSGVEIRDFQKEMQAFAKQMGSGAPRSSSPNAGGGGYAKDWENKGGNGSAPRAPKVDL